MIANENSAIVSIGLSRYVLLACEKQIMFLLILSIFALT